MLFEQFIRNCRYGSRALIENPGASFVAIFTLALGIGANTAIFSIVKTVLLAPLPFREPDQLVSIWDTRAATGQQSLVLPANFEAWKERSGVFEQLAAARQQIFTLTGSGEPEDLTGEAVTIDYFSLLGIQPITGRTFLSGEDQSGKELVAVISAKLFKQRFNSDASVIGKNITLNSTSYQIIGVVPDLYSSGSQAQVRTPLIINTLLPARFLRVFGRVKEGVTRAEAEAKLQTMAERLAVAYPELDQGWTVMVTSLKDQILGGLRTAMLVLFAAVIFVLLIACANVANILLARILARNREMAVRRALGAKRWTIIQQLLTESVILAFAGGLLGLLVAHFGIGLVVRFGPKDIPRLDQVNIDASVLAFTTLVSLLTGIIFGVVPAMGAAQTDLNVVLKTAGGKQTESKIGLRARDLFIVAEVVLALVLLVGAGLLLDSFYNLESRNFGFEPRNLLTLRIHLPGSQYRDTAQKMTFYQDMQRQINAIPGIVSSSISSSLPVDEIATNTEFHRIDRPLPPGQHWTAATQIIGPDYFLTMHIPVKRGRTFSQLEFQQPKHSILINEALAQRFLAGEDPVGKWLSLGDDNKPDEIIGVTGDVMQANLSATTEPTLYWPYVRLPFPAMAVVIRTSSNPVSVARSVGNQIHSIDPNQPVADIMSMDELLSGAVARPRFNALLLSIFACCALALATVGVYGIISYSVDQNTREIGIRIALGAQRSEVLKIVLLRGLKLVMSGILIGTLLSLVLTRFVSSLLFGVHPYDPVIFTTVCFLLIAVSVLAGYIPARRATRIEPLAALRYE